MRRARVRVSGRRLRRYLVTFLIAIHESLPPIWLRVFGDDYGLVQRIDVVDPAERRMIQSIPWPPDQETAGRPFEGTPDLTTSDLNFDGYEDLMVQSWAGATGNAGAVIWIYEPTARRFVYNRILSRLSNVEPDPARKRLVTYSTGGAAGMICSAEALEWINGRPVVVTTVDQDFDERTREFVRTIREFRNGRLIRTTRDIYRRQTEERTCAIP